MKQVFEALSMAICLVAYITIALSMAICLVAYITTAYICFGKMGAIAAIVSVVIATFFWVNINLRKN